MGDIPAQIKIVCPGCNTQFRLRLKKGRLPKDAIPCPRCGDDIPVVEANMRPVNETTDEPSDTDAFAPPPRPTGAPETFIFEKPSSDSAPARPASTRPRSGTAMGAPRLSHRSTPLEDNDFSDLDIMPGLTQSDPKSTFLGMGAGVKSTGAPGDTADPAPGDHTTVVSSEALEQIRNAIAPSADSASGFARDAATTTRAPALSDAPKPASNPRGSFKTSEQDAIDLQTLKAAGAFASEKTNPNTSNAALIDLAAETAEHDPPFSSDPDPTSEVPKQMVLGRIKIKQKLRKTLKNEDFELPVESAAAGHQADDTAKPKDADRTTEQLALTQSVSASAADAAATRVRKPSLASLLKKARDRKIELPAPSDRSGAQIPTPAKAAQRSKSAADSARKKSAAALDRALNSLADETARAIVEKQSTGTLKMIAPSHPGERPAQNRDVPAYDTGDSSMIDLLRRRVAENQQPGAASERRGSGYIRLPTAEIQDVLGQGTYRLRVEDIIYEPIDKAGLTELIKRGVLMGAAEIAQSDGDWMPLGEHPMLAELRQKMAAEAHAMLATLKPKSGKGAARTKDWPITAAERAGLGHYDSSADDFADLKDSTEMATIPALKRSMPLPMEGDPDFDTANSGLFADVDALRSARTRATTQKLYSAADISLEEPSEEATAEPVAPEKAAAPEVIAEPEVAPTPEPDAASEPEEDSDALASDPPDALLEDFDPPKSRGGFGKVLGVLVLLIIVAGGALLFTPYGQPYLDQVKAKFATFSGAPDAPTQKDAPLPDNKKTPVAENSQPVRPAIAAAKDEVESAAQIDLSSPEAQEKLAAKLSAEGEHAAAADILGGLWEAQRDDAALAERYFGALINAKKFGAASRLAVHSMLLAEANDSADSLQKFEALYYEAIEKNPELGPYQTVNIDADTQADAAVLVLEGKKNNRLGFNLSKDQKPTFVFKPSQAQFERDWRMSIAAWRLCQMMVCNFDIPRTRPARIERSHFAKLIAKDADANTAKLAALNWVREDGKEYLYGALIDAVEPPARFPIEDISLWRPWLAPGSADDLKTPLAEGLAPLKRLDQDFYQPLLAQAGELSLAQLAGQLSSVLVFDYLTNNWDRFHPDATLWGTRLGLRDGVLVSSANLNTFQPRASTRIKGRFEWSSRFSQATVASLRLIKPEQASERLFPEPSAAEKARLTVFWNQRDLALKRIDSMVQARGKNEVLRFE